MPASARPLARVSKRVLAVRGDDQLVARVRVGDVAAFEVLYERYLPGILSFSRHMLGSREEAEDAVQQVFTSAHRALEAGDREIDFRPWLYTVARNRCLSVLRARREQTAEELEGATAGLHDDVERRADLRELVADLGQLPDEQRAALVLTELRALTHDEVAGVLGCDKAKVKRLVFRARSGLLERREGRDASCQEIQAELSSARGGALRRGPLRHHLEGCPVCSAFLADVRHQRKMMALILPVIPSAGLKGSVFAALGFGAGAGAGAAGGGLAAGVGGAATGAVGGAAAGAPVAATLAKLAVAGALVGSAGVAGEAALDNGNSKPPGRGTDAPARDRARPPVSAPVGVGQDPRGAEGAGPAGRRRSGPDGAAARQRDSQPGDPVRSGPKKPPGSGRNDGRAGKARGRDGRFAPDARGRKAPKQKPAKPSPQTEPAAPRRGRDGSDPPVREPSKPPQPRAPAARPKTPDKGPTEPSEGGKSKAG